ncbi:hypothetical protein L1987_84405 [Smallanthus sonchifolius]|uniref:Uncharacterized protein n=1 Tax=Smallanthus sonchifolius TaxID=185202 RepID=A0ACB8YFT3_9ASTR|nr:hypothetical protein L1987_84405 [Smallanthus sonchifolius]
MSGYNRQGNRSVPAKSDSRIEHTNIDSPTDWKPKAVKGYISSVDQINIFDKAKPPGIPESFNNMVEKAIQDSNEFIRGNIGRSDERKVIPFMSPDECIANFFTKSGRLGLHQDKDESETSLKKGLPVVLFSIGDSAEFLYGEIRSIDEADKVTLESGDVLIFGGKSRLIYHGVTSIVPDSAPTSLMEATDMRADADHQPNSRDLCLLGDSLNNLKMSGYSHEVNHGKSDCRIKLTNVGSRINWKPMAVKIGGSLGSASCSQNDKVTGESLVKDVNVGSRISWKPKAVKVRDAFRFIFRLEFTTAYNLGYYDHLEKRNQNKQSMKGQNIIILGPGMVLLKGYITSVDQINIVRTCRELGISDGGFYQPGYTGGTKLPLQMMCLGKNWDPESHKYTELRPFDKAKPPRIPENCGLRGVVSRDKDDSGTSLKKGLPVVSFSIGDSAEFLYGETRNIDEADKLILESGDVLIFGGKSRSLYYGITSILPDTAPTSLIEATDLRPGRLNLAFRIDSLSNLEISGYSCQGNHGKSDCRINHTNVGSRTDWKPKAVKIDGSLDSASCSQFNKSSLTGESLFENVASDVKNLNLTPISFDDVISKKVKQLGDKSQIDDDSGRLIHPVFDICPKRVGSVINLKAPLHVMNREKRNQSKCTMKGQNIIILGPGMVLLKGYIQINMVRTCRELGISDGGFYQPGKAIKDSNEFIRGNAGSSDERKVFPSMSPDICIVRTEESETSLRKGLPVVSFSLGDSAEFLYGETRSIDEADKVTLESGDVLIFGGKSRLIYHG